MNCAVALIDNLLNVVKCKYDAAVFSFILSQTTKGHRGCQTFQVEMYNFKGNTV